MNNFMKTKEDVEFHSDGFRPSKPAVNVKVYDSLDNGFRKWKLDYPDHDPRFTVEWIEEHVSDDHASDIFWWTCQMRWEDLEAEAQEIWGSHMINDHRGRHQSTKVYSEGRSGGWAVVDGIDHDVDSWDAIEFNKWKRFAKFARATADYVMVDVVDYIYENDFQEWQLEESELAAPEIPEGMRNA